MRKQDVLNLINKGEFGYGSSYSLEDFAFLCGIKSLNMHTQDPYEAVKRTKKYDLDILNASGAINAQLIPIGRICRINSTYGTIEIPAAGETMAEVDKLEEAGTKKYRTAKKLRQGFSKVHPLERPSTVSSHMASVIQERAKPLATV